MFRKTTFAATAISASSFLGVPVMAATSAPAAEVANSAAPLVDDEPAVDLNFDLSIHEQPEFSDVRAVGFSSLGAENSDNEM